RGRTGSRGRCGRRRTRRTSSRARARRRARPPGSGLQTRRPLRRPGGPGRAAASARRARRPRRADPCGTRRRRARAGAPVRRRERGRGRRRAAAGERAYREAARARVHTARNGQGRSDTGGKRCRAGAGSSTDIRGARVRCRRARPARLPLRVPDPRARHLPDQPLARRHAASGGSAARRVRAHVEGARDPGLGRGLVGDAADRGRPGGPHRRRAARLDGDAPERRSCRGRRPLVLRSGRPGPEPSRLRARQLPLRALPLPVAPRPRGRRLRGRRRRGGGDRRARAARPDQPCPLQDRRDPGRRADRASSARGRGVRDPRLLSVGGHLALGRVRARRRLRRRRLGQVALRGAGERLAVRAAGSRRAAAADVHGLAGARASVRVRGGDVVRARCGPLPHRHAERARAFRSHGGLRPDRGDRRRAHPGELAPADAAPDRPRRRGGLRGAQPARPAPPRWHGDGARARVPSRLPRADGATDPVRLPARRRHPARPALLHVGRRDPARRRPDRRDRRDGRLRAAHRHRRAALTGPRPEAPARAGIAAFLLGAAGMFATMYSTQAILPELSREFAVTPSRAGLSVSVVVLAVALGAWAWGPVSDRVGRTRAISLASWLLVLPTVGVALAPWFELLLAFRALQRLCMPGLLIVGAPYVVELFVPAVGIRAMGWYVSALVAGGLVGRVGVALATAVVGWRWAIGLLALLPLAAAAGMHGGLPPAPLPARSSRVLLGLLDRRLGAVALAGAALFFTFVGTFTYV